MFSKILKRKYLVSHWTRNERLLKYIKDKGYGTKEIDRMISAYSLVYKRRTARNIYQYNEIVKDYPLLNFQLRSLLIYDYYDMLPMNRKIYYSAYYELNDNFRNLLDDCMRTAKSMHVRDLTISVEASSCASFFEYLQKSRTYLSHWTVYKETW